MNLAWLAITLMGVILGLVGGGGSILTVPIFVYLFMIKPVEATAYSLFVVGIVSLVGSLFYIKKKYVNFKVGLVFAIPGILGVYTMRRYGLPSIPEIINLGGLSFSKESLILNTFILLMLIASYSMLKRPKEQIAVKKKVLNYPVIAVEGIVVGLITGLVGAGGGFLIVPALVLLAGLEIKVAIGTSLLIIAAKSLIGFTGDLHNFGGIDWVFLFKVTGIAFMGMLLGVALSQKLPSEHLKKGFGWFVLAIAGFMLIKAQS